MSKTRELKQAHREAEEEMDRELNKVALEEFPVGTPVKWIRTFERNTNKPIYLNGVVHRTGPYGFTLKTKSGATHNKYPWELDHAATADGGGKV